MNKIREKYEDIGKVTSLRHFSKAAFAVLCILSRGRELRFWVAGCCLSITCPETEVNEMKPVHKC